MCPITSPNPARTVGSNVAPPRRPHKSAPAAPWRARRTRLPRELEPKPLLEKPIYLLPDWGRSEVLGFVTNAYRTAIARRAYEKYLQRGCVVGYDVEDWLVSESELRLEWIRVEF